MMQEANPDVLIAATASIVASFVGNNSVRPEEVAGLIGQTHSSLSAVGKAPEVVDPPAPAVPIKKSVTNDHIICLEDGKKFKSLKRHLSVLGMTPSQYRAKWGLPEDYPMVAPAYASLRSKLAKDIGLGQRTESVSAE